MPSDSEHVPWGPRPCPQQAPPTIAPKRILSLQEGKENPFPPITYIGKKGILRGSVRERHA